MKQPKDAHKYIDPRMAAAQLINLALDNVMFAKPGILVKWNTSISYMYTKEFGDDGGVVLPMRGSFSNSERELQVSAAPQAEKESR